MKSGKVSKVTWLTKKVVSVEVSDFGEIEFVPGQFILVDVGQGHKRAYGIGNHPENGKQKKIELFIDISPGGIGSKYFEKIKVGDKIEFSRPCGGFILTKERAASSQTLVFLATGTGICPIKCMLESILLGDNKTSSKPLILYFGLRHDKDIFLDAHFKSLAKKHKNFTYTLTLSQPSKSWTGKTGYVIDHLVKDNVGSKKPAYYVCGGSRSVKGIIEHLKKQNVKDENIFFEQF